MREMEQSDRALRGLLVLSAIYYIIVMFQKGFFNYVLGTNFGDYLSEEHFDATSFQSRSSGGGFGNTIVRYHYDKPIDTVVLVAMIYRCFGHHICLVFSSDLT